MTGIKCLIQTLYVCGRLYSHCCHDIHNILRETEFVNGLFPANRQNSAVLNSMAARKPLCGERKKKTSEKSEVLKERLLARLAVFVTLAEHIVEGGNFVLATFDFAGFFVVALLTDVANDAFAVELLFETAESLLHCFTLAQFNFY